MRWLRASKKSECHRKPIGREISRQLHWVRTSSCESARITDDKDFLNALFLEVNDGVAITGRGLLHVMCTEYKYGFYK